jgi:serine/threonine-protein phosphatase 2A regulatory subunit B''
MNTGESIYYPFSIALSVKSIYFKHGYKSVFMTRLGIIINKFQINFLRNGYLREKDLENYIFELIPTFAQLQKLQENFFPFYVITAVRKFFFFLDPKKTGRIYIKDMLTSPILAELYELRQEKNNNEEGTQNWYKNLYYLFIELKL